VCKRCYYKFASRRQLAFIVDWIVWLPIAITLEFSLSEAMVILPLEPLLAEFVFIGFSWIGFRLLFVCKDCFSGHSPGEWISGVRVIDRDTLEPIGIVGSPKRNRPLAAAALANCREVLLP
jgi:hypothetical protein